MSPLGSSPSWSRYFQEFRCRECGNDEAYRSRPRGFFEKGLLPALMLRPVRCDRCYHRSYIFRSVPVLERAGPTDKPRPSHGTSDTGTRVA